MRDEDRPNLPFRLKTEPGDRWENCDGVVTCYRANGAIAFQIAADAYEDFATEARAASVVVPPLNRGNRLDRRILASRQRRARK